MWSPQMLVLIKMKQIFLPTLLFLLPIVFAPTQAQSGNNCDAVIESALESVDEACFTMNRNEVCYGHNQITAVGEADNQLVGFDLPGDVAAINSVKSITTAPLVPEDDIWGVAMLRLQANLEGTIPGQAVTFLVFGDAELEQVTHTDSETHAFVFSSGVGESSCGEIPEGGLLFQSPEGDQKLDITLNNIEISAGSALFVQFTVERTLRIAVIEGEAEITSFETTETLTTNTQLQVPLDVDGLADGIPRDLSEFDAAPLDAMLRLLPGDPQIAPCGGLSAQVEPGMIYVVASDGPHYPGIADSFDFQASMDGQALPAVTDIVYNNEQYQQVFDVGVLAEGEYAIEFNSSLNENITDPLGQNWGPEQWSYTCALSVQ